MHLLCEEYVVWGEGPVHHIVFSEIDQTFKDLTSQLGRGAWLSELPRPDVVLQIVIIPLRPKDHTLCGGGRGSHFNSFQEANTSRTTASLTIVKLIVDFKVSSVISGLLAT